MLTSAELFLTETQSCDMLTAEQDATGQMMYDHLRGIETDEIIEREDGYINVGPGAAMYFAGFRNWRDLERRGIAHVRGKVLDVGCGAGRCSLYLQSRGHEVLGIDWSPLAIKTCHQRGVKHALVLPVTGMSRRVGADFDTILMYGSNFGLLANKRRARWLLRRFHGLTTPGARIVASTTDPYDTTSPVHRRYHRRNRERGRLGGQIRLRCRYGSLATPWFDYLLVSKRELRALVRETGWQVGELIEGDGAQYVAVLTKT